MCLPHVFGSHVTCVMSVLLEGGEMVETEGTQGAGAEDHQSVVRDWIASAIAGIREMATDELARQQVAARLF